MKERFKFRAWDSELMWYQGELYFVFGSNDYWEAYVYGDDVPIFTKEDAKIMQYSGLQDKNNKDIYEGDIISLKNEEGHHILAICEYDIARRIIHENEVDIPSFYFRVPAYDNKKTFPIVNNYQNKHDLELFEIVGNIHENIDLIND